MRHGLLASLAAFPLVALAASPALAQSSPVETPAPATPAPDPKPASPTGPSPYSALVAKGDGAYLGRDFDGAVAAYREEIAQNASSAVAHYRLGEAQLAKGDTNEAEQSWQNALRFAEKDGSLRAKALFVLADLKERTKAYDDALLRWKAYSEHASARPETKTHAATAAERTKRIEEWKKISADAALVKERIEKRVKEAEESLKKSSK